MRTLASKTSSIDSYNGFGHQLWDLAGSFPSLDLRFALEKSLKNAVDGSDVVTFSRSSSATFINSSRNIETAAVNVPRFDHDPVTGECLGLLIEPSSNNLFSYSAGTKSNYTLSSTGTFTDLTLNALGVFPGILIQSSGSTGAGITSNTFSYSLTESVFTVWMKDDGTTHPVFRIGIEDTLDGAFKYSYVQYNSGDLDNINSYSVTNFDTFSFGEISLLSVKGAGDNVIKIVFTFLKGAMNFGFSAKAFVRQQSSTVGEAITFLGWQLEENKTYASSYIPTNGTSATRSADLAAITGANFSSWYGNNEGTAFAEAEFSSDTADLQCLYDFSGNNTDNEITIYKQPNPTGYVPSLINKLKTNIRKDGSGIFGTTFSDIQFNQKIKTIFTFENNHVNTAVGSSVGTTNTNITLPTVNQLTLGQRKDGLKQAVVYLNRFTFWPKKIYDAGLKAATGNPIDTATAGPSSNSTPVGLPTVSGTLQEGSVLTASNLGVTKDYDQLNTDGSVSTSLFSYQWRSDGVAIEGATSNQYTLTSNEVGKTMSVVVSFTDDFGNIETLTSNETETITAAASGAVFEFKYHDYGSNIIGEKLVFWETTTSSAAPDSSTRYNLIWERDTSLFPANTKQSDDWKRVQLDLQSLVNKTGKFIFLHKIGFSFYGDFAIDRWIFTPRTGSAVTLSYTSFRRAAAVNDMESPFEVTAATNIATATTSETTTFSNAINKQWSYDSGGQTGSSATGPDNGASAGSDNSNQTTNRGYIYFEASGSNGYNENEWSPLITGSSYSL